MKNSITPNIYVNNIKILYKITENVNLSYYELENGDKIKGSIFKSLEKDVYCKCGKNKKIKHIKINKDYICKSCKTKGNNNPLFGKSFYDIWIKKYGKEVADQKIQLKKEMNKGKNNPFFGKSHTEDQKKIWSTNKKGKYSGENNPMYKKSVYNIWVEKYGKEVADSKISILNLKKIIINEV